MPCQSRRAIASAPSNTGKNTSRESALRGHKLLFLAIALTGASAVKTAAQGTTAPAQAPSSTSAPKSLSSSLGVYVFPAKNQTPDQQNQDEAACFSWAKEQTGIDPLAPPPTAAPAQGQSSQAPPPNPAKGSGAKGAAGGAAAGAAIGAVAGDAGEGAAIGATAGAIRGRRQGKKAQKQAEAQQQQAQAQQQQQAQATAQQQQDTRKATYNKAFSACLEGKGYTVK